MKPRDLTSTILSVILLILSSLLYWSMVIIFLGTIIHANSDAGFPDFGFLQKGAVPSIGEKLVQTSFSIIVIVSLIVLIVALYRGLKVRKVPLYKILTSVAILNFFFAVCLHIYRVIMIRIEVRALRPWGFEWYLAFGILIILLIVWYLQASLLLIKPKLNIVQNKIV